MVSVKRMMILLSLAVFVVATTGSATASVNLELRPGHQDRMASDYVTLGLYAVASSGADEYVSAMDVVLLWNPGYLEFLWLGDPQPDWMWDGLPTDGIYGLMNDDLDDGDLFYSAFAWFGDSAVVTPEGLLVVEFVFSAVTDTPSTTVNIATGYQKNGSFFDTIVFSGLEPNKDITGTLGSAEVTIVPEPVSGFVLLSGLAALAVRIRRKR